MPPTITRTNSCLMSSATVPSAPPSASDPTSPMKMSAGYELYQRNPRLAPTSAPQKIVSSPIERRHGRQLQVLGEDTMAADVGERGEAPPRRRRTR